MRTRRRGPLSARALFAVGAAVALQHLGLHVAGSPSALSDLLAGYPTAGVLTVAFSPGSDGGPAGLQRQRRESHKAQS